MLCLLVLSFALWRQAGHVGGRWRYARYGTVVVKTQTGKGQTLRPAERRHKHTNTNELLVASMFLFVFDDENITFNSKTRRTLNEYIDTVSEKRTSENEQRKVPKSSSYG